MQTTKDKEWMDSIIAYFQESRAMAEKRLRIAISKGIEYEGPGIEAIELVIPKCPVRDIEPDILFENYHEIMAHIQETVADQVTAPKLKIILDFQYRLDYGKDINENPLKTLIINSEWQEK